MAVSLTVQLTPPHASSTLSSLSPHSFLQDPQTLSSFRRKTKLNLRTTDQKNFSLDPQSRSNERTISEYHDRVLREMSNDRRKIHATFPFDDVIDTTKKEQKSLKVCRRIIYLMNACLLSPELKQRITELESTNRTMKEDNHTMKENNRSMQDTINTMKEDNRSMQDTIHFMQMERLDLYIGNMLVDFVEKIYRDRRSSLPPGTGNDPSHSTTRHAQAAQQIRKKDLVEMGIAPKYYDALQMFSKVYNPRPDLRVKLT
jgi:hypothetical protein